MLYGSSLRRGTPGNLFTGEETVGWGREGIPSVGARAAFVAQRDSTTNMATLSQICRQKAGLDGHQVSLKETWPGQTPLGYGETPIMDLQCECMKPGSAV